MLADRIKIALDERGIAFASGEVAEKSPGPLAEEGSQRKEA